MGEVFVDFEVEVERENGDGKGSVEESGTSEGVNGISRDDLGSSCAESVDRKLRRENFKFMEQSSEDLSDPNSSQFTMIDRKKINHSRGVLPRKFLNENFPPKKKLKLVKRIATIQDDGTLQFDVGENIKPQSSNCGTEVIYNGDTIKEIVITEDTELLPPLQIVMLIVGTRGDVQPFIAIGKRLQDDGHRVRLATHSKFKEFVMAAGLEFYPLGGDPKVLAAYMVKNKGFLPSEIHLQRSQIKEIIFSLLPACTDPDTNISFKDIRMLPRHSKYHCTYFLRCLGRQRVSFHILFLVSGNQLVIETLLKWLEDKEKPIYIGFGSLPVEEPEKMTVIIVRALEITGQWGIINKGWGGLGNLAEPKDFVYLLENCSHDWFFTRCAAVVNPLLFYMFKCTYKEVKSFLAFVHHDREIMGFLSFFF